MEKNTKLKNGVDQVQNSCAIETKNCNQDTSENFLTSDDFCIVQKKKGKKYLDPLDFDTHFQVQSGLEKGDNEDANKSSTFWTFKFNKNSSNSITKELELQSSDCNEKVISTENFEFCNDAKYHTIPQSNFESGDEKPALENVKSENSTVTITEIVDKIKPASKLEAVGNDCGSKKKNKKKDGKKKALEEEVERIMRELELVEKPHSKQKNTASIVSCSKTSQKINGIETTADQHSTTSDKKENASNNRCEVASNKCDNESLENSSSNNPNIDKRNTESESVLIVKNVLEKKKGKRKDSEKSEEVEKSSVNEQEISKGENDSILQSEEKLQKNQPDSERRGKRPSKKQLAMIQEALKKAKEEEERLKKEEEKKQKMAEEAERIRLEKLRQEEEKKEKKKLKMKEKREKMKAEGRLLSKSQKRARARMEATLAALRQQGVDVPQIGDKKPLSHGPRLGNCKNFHRRRYNSCQSTQSCDSVITVSDRQKSESFSSQESSGKDSLLDLPSSFDSTDELTVKPESDKGIFSCSDESDDNINHTSVKRHIIDSNMTKSKTETVIQSKSSEIESKINLVKYRSPVVCVLGHVDTGKTKILDYIRKTHVQDSEAGGITQQIGATMIPQDALKEKCKMVKKFSASEMKIPGLLVIDTPGHESFSNLRSRGSSICDIAVLVVDIMHGLEPQTIESINLLKKGKIPFVVALNKVDRLYGWKGSKDEDIETTIKSQSPTTQVEFSRRCQEIILQFANQCINAILFYENKDPRSYISMVPASAITGDGMGNVLSAVVQLSESLMSKKLIFSSELAATVLEVKAIAGLGTTIDVILVNGRLQEGDTIILTGQEGPIVTQIRSLLMPQPLKELRVKNPYIEYKAIEGAQGVKIIGKDLDKAVAGLPLFVASNHNQIESLKEEVNSLFRDTINSIKTSERGVYVQASTLGSLEALLDFLSASGIQYFNVKIGPVVKKDVMKASIMLEHDVMYAAILAFDVKIERDAQELADSLGVRIFHADIIYHLCDMYIKYRDDLLLKRKEEIKRHAVFPCKLKIFPDFVFKLSNPIVLGVRVEQGTLKLGTPLCVPAKDALEIGVVSSIDQNNHKINCAKKGDEVTIKIDPKSGEFPKVCGSHFDLEDMLVSRITRQSIDVLKEHFRDELQQSDWHLIVELKKMLHIV